MERHASLWLSIVQPRAGFNSRQIDVTATRAQDVELDGTNRLGVGKPERAQTTVCGAQLQIAVVFTSQAVVL